MSAIYDPHLAADYAARGAAPPVAEHADLITAGRLWCVSCHGPSYTGYDGYIEADSADEALAIVAEHAEDEISGSAGDRAAWARSVGWTAERVVAP